VRIYPVFIGEVEIALTRCQ